MPLTDDDITIIDILRNPDTGEFFSPRELIQNLTVTQILPGLYGFFLVDRISVELSIPQIEIYSKDSSGADDFQFEIITSGTPNPGQFKVIPAIGFCYTHPDNSGIDVRNYYDGLGSNFSVENITKLVDDAVSDLGIDNTPDWDSPSTTSAPSVDATNDRILATLQNSINYSKVIGELFFLDFPKDTNYTFNPMTPRTYFPALNLSEIDVTLTVDNTDIPQVSLDHLRSKYLIYLPGKSGEVFQWTTTVTGSDIEFPNTTSANAVLAALVEDKDVQGTYTNHRTVNIDGSDFAITGINLVTRVVTVSGSPTTGSQTARFYSHRIAGSTTTARLFEVSGESFIAGGDPDGYFIGGLRTRGYFQGHWHASKSPGSGGVLTGFNGSTNRVNVFDLNTTQALILDAMPDTANGTPRTRKTTHSPALTGIPYQWFPGA